MIQLGDANSRGSAYIISTISCPSCPVCRGLA